MSRFGDLEAAVMGVRWAAGRPLRVREVAGRPHRERPVPSGTVRAVPGNPR